jgi:hypothetical protein
MKKFLIQQKVQQPPGKPAPPNPNIAALPIGLLTTFFTVLAAFLKNFLTNMT